MGGSTKTFRLRWFALLLGMLLAPISVVQAQNGGSLDVTTLAGPAAGYKLGVADKVRIIVFNEEKLGGEFIVNADGTIGLPLIGNVQVAGRTTAEVSNDVTHLYADGYLRDPRISIEVLTYRPFFILGEVTKPGEYPYSNGLTVMNAVATASGYTYRASKGEVYIKKAGESEEHKVKLTAGLEVGPGDTVRIPERYF